jgi:YfiH family protein
VSEPPFDSNNLGRSVGDEPARVAENHRRFAVAAGYEPAALYETSQVHGSVLRAVTPGEQVAAVRAEEADALLAPAGGLAVGVRVADCAAVLVHDAGTGAVCAIHAGWRGTVRGVVEAGVCGLLARGSAPQVLTAAIFPHIRACCFEVGEDVAAELLAASPDPTVVDRTRERPHVDLTAILVAKLLVLGLSRARIDDVPGCTRCEPERFFSFRRDGKRSGRHLAAIVSGSS